MTKQEKPKLREMPTPKYLTEAPNTISDGNIKWIGIKSYSPNKTLKNFLWWTNFLAEDLTNIKTRREIAKSIATIKLQMNAYSAIGPPIDFASCRPSENYVALLKDEGIYGMYIEESRRPGFNFFANVGTGRKIDEESLKFRSFYRKALFVMPYPMDLDSRTQLRASGSGTGYPV